MRFLFFALFLLTACGTSETKYRTKHEWVGTGGGFMHVEKREGVIYYYRFEELDGFLKLHLMLHNTTEQPFKLHANDFSLRWNNEEVLPFNKLKLIKQAEEDAKKLEGMDQKHLLHETTLVDRFMMDGEFQLVPDSPTKTYVLFTLPPKNTKQFTMLLGPRSTALTVKREP